MPGGPGDGPGHAGGNVSLGWPGNALGSPWRSWRSLLGVSTEPPTPATRFQMKWKTTSTSNIDFNIQKCIFKNQKFKAYLCFSKQQQLLQDSGLRKRQAVGPGQANLHKSFHSGFPLQAVLNNICLHQGEHSAGHLLFLCSSPRSLPPSLLCELNKSCH
ncbi:hypothetical protein ATANTOWER_002772 [Ataeniobius toweri]|uniref:Uncharacterized protein n=1 Tax=Ataeniobius toweri TaxID=208326 RepID=A0ABU7BA37_9TELE|nr:hypothetical protein [Ataeniobius toweri]